MSNTTAQPHNSENKADLAALEAENKLLCQENEKLRQQTESVAKANARAAELMLKLEEVNNNLKSEIKKRQQVEEKLQRANSEMEMRVRERTAELSKEIAERKEAEEQLQKLNEELAKTVKQLTMANRELADFLKIAAHDLKTPLRGIGTLACWIATDYGDTLDEQGQRRIRLLVRRVERIYKLLDSLVEYSRIRRNEQKEEGIDLNTVLAEVIAEMERPGNIEITVKDELPIVICEKTHMMQVFQSLLSNAVKYMDKPQGQVRINCVEEQGFWKFTVADNGVGIEEKHFERIFKIFQTLDQHYEFESTGGGLTLAKKIIELHGGKIWVESTPGEGSTFFFTFPKQKSNIVEHAKLEANIVS